VIEQMGGVQPVVDGAQACRAFRMPGPMSCLQAARMGDVGSVHGEKWCNAMAILHYIPAAMAL
jgi:hypothetical protein